MPVNLSYGGAVLASLALLFPSASFADEPKAMDVDEASSVVDRADKEIARMRRDVDDVGHAYGMVNTTKGGRLERRLREADSLVRISDYVRAAVVLLDLVEDPANKGHPRYDECVYRLADAMRRSKNYSGARRYFEELLQRAEGQRLREVAVALLEIASATDRQQDVETYIKRLRDAGGMFQPDVDYIYGKMLFKVAGNDADKLDKAYLAFRSVPPGNPVAAQAAYYAAVALVQLGRLDEAVQAFQETLRRIQPGNEGSQMRDLTHLSLGRLYQEKGDIAKSIAAYGEVPPTSSYFADTLFETAWTHVKAASLASDEKQRQKSYRSALRSSKAMRKAQPNSPLYAQARILEGNIQIRLGASEKAYASFQRIVDRYGPAGVKVGEMLSREQDATSFFQRLMAADLENLGGGDLLPPEAVTWALAEGDVSRAVGMAQGLEESRRDVTESESLVHLLEAALGGEQKYSMIPGLAVARTTALSLENRIVNQKRLLLDVERRIMWPHLSDTDRAQIGASSERARSLEEDVESLPQNGKQIRKARTKITRTYGKVEERADGNIAQVASLQETLSSAERWLNDRRSKLSPDKAGPMSQEIETLRAEVSGLGTKVEAIHAELKTQALVAGMDGGQHHDRQVRDDYSRLVDSETQGLRTARGRAPSDVQDLLARLDQQRSVMQAIEFDLRQMQVGLDQRIAERVAEIREALGVEVGRLGEHLNQHGEIARDSDQIIGPVAAKTLNAVAEQLKELVLKADVGIIDVAWSRKEGETKKVTELMKQQQAHTQELDREFADVLGNE